MAHARLIPGAALVAVVGCASSAPPAPPARSAPPVSQAETPPTASAPGGFVDRGWGEIESARFIVVLPLPERGAWVVDDAARPWLEARHPSTHSRLRLRSWPASRRARPQTCEEQARLWRPDTPEADPETVLETRALDAPPGYRTHLTVGVHRRAGDELEGYALAFGAKPGRCLALVYTTLATGLGADRAVGDRLLVIADGSIARLRTPSIDDRARGERVVR